MKPILLFLMLLRVQWIPPAVAQKRLPADQAGFFQRPRTTKSGRGALKLHPARCAER